jgi:hypothetical protein
VSGSLFFQVRSVPLEIVMLDGLKAIPLMMMVFGVVTGMGADEDGPYEDVGLLHPPTPAMITQHIANRIRFVAIAHSSMIGDCIGHIRNALSPEP